MSHLSFSHPVLGERCNTPYVYGLGTVSEDLVSETFYPEIGVKFVQGTFKIICSNKPLEMYEDEILVAQNTQTGDLSLIPIN